MPKPTNDQIDAVLSHVDQTIDQSLQRLFDLIRIPSVSTDPAYRDHCRRAAEWLSSDLASIGFDASVRDTTGHPMVVGHEKRAVGPHVLFMAITTSSRSIRCRFGRPILSNRSCSHWKMEIRQSSRAAPPTTRDS